MFTTAFGVFDGTSWERLCQLVFKSKYGGDGYQQIPPSPGDYGLEGFTSISGLGFQCYCPEKQYSRLELYSKQRDKITADIAKLKQNGDDLAALLGPTKIKNWIFVTPELASHALHRHARKKEGEVKNWALPIIDENFRIMLYDAEHFMIEINQIQSAKGLALDFSLTPPELDELTEPPEAYEQNVKRKCGARLEPMAHLSSYEKRLATLYDSTLQSFIEGDPFLRRIEATAPIVHYRLIRLINEYAIEVKEKGVTWRDSAEDLTRHVTDGLAARIVGELRPEIDATTASKISRLIVSRWLAVCQLDYE